MFCYAYDYAIFGADIEWALQNINLPDWSIMLRKTRNAAKYFILSQPIVDNNIVQT